MRMCRACVAAIVAPEEDHQRIRRAAGLEVQVSDLVTSPSELDPEGDFDVIIIKGTEAPAVTGPALLSIGPEQPAWADNSIPDGEDLADRLPGAVVKALIERRKR
jgi:hypothetical protein